MVRDCSLDHSHPVLDALGEHPQQYAGHQPLPHHQGTLRRSRRRRGHLHQQGSRESLDNSFAICSIGGRYNCHLDL